MKKTWVKCVLAIGVCSILGVVPLIPVLAQAQDPQEVVSPQAGFFAYSGGPVRGKVARTQTTSFTLAESATWVSLPGASLVWTVPTGTTDLFNVAFSAECRVFNGGADDYVRIRIADTVAGVTTFLEPYDGAQAFCSADAYATHKGNWVKRVQSGTHTLQVQLWIFDGAPAEVVSAWIDDWTFEDVVYD
jgi:hypothetical protein